MKKSYLALLVSIIFILATVGSSFAAMGEGTVSAKKGVDLTLFGSNRLIPTYCSNMNDYNDDNRDWSTLDEGGWGAGFFIRNELRLGFSGKGENFGFRVILEDDIHYSKANVDRNTYADNGGRSSDFGSEFSVERSKFWYDFGPVKLTTGWDVTFQDLKTGGLVYGDDHPFVTISGKAGEGMDWSLTMLLINDSDDVNQKKDFPFFLEDKYRDADWYVYNAKFNFKVGGMTLSPFATFSDMRKGVQAGNLRNGALDPYYSTIYSDDLNRKGNAQSYYFGLEAYGKFGIFMPSFELVGVTGTINDAHVDGLGNSGDYDISSFALFASLKIDLMPEFQPYIGGYWVEGDDKWGDDDLDGFVGITNITRYTPTFGMEGAYMYEHLWKFGAPLYGLTPERTGSRYANYGGISAQGTGENPGLIYLGMGATGKFCNNVSYKVQTAYMWYEEKDGMGLDNDEIGWSVDAQVKYPFSSNFSASYTISGLVPGDGLEDFMGGEDDVAWITRAELVWKW